MGIDWIKALSEKSERELEIEAQIDKEISEFDKNPEYQAHQQRMHDFYHEQHEELVKRMKEFDKAHPVRPSRERTPEEMAEIREKNIKRHNEWVESVPQNVKDAVSLVSNMSAEDRRNFDKLLRQEQSYEELEEYENPITTEQDVDELQEILVQTVIEFIKARKLTDIWSVGFSIDDLQESVKYGTWCPASDGSINVEGIQDDVRKTIGHNLI